MNDSGVQGGATWFWRETLGPFQEMFLPEEPQASQFPSHDLGQPRQTPGAVVHPSFGGSQARTWPGQEVFPSFRSAPGRKELGTVFSDVLRSLPRASCSGTRGDVSDVSEAVRQASASLTPSVCGMQRTSC